MSETLSWCDPKKVFYEDGFVCDSIGVMGIS